MSTERSRQAAGQRTGGQFKAEQHTEGGVELGQHTSAPQHLSAPDSDDGVTFEQAWERRYGDLEEVADRIEDFGLPRDAIDLSRSAFVNNVVLDLAGPELREKLAPALTGASSRVTGTTFSVDIPDTAEARSFIDTHGTAFASGKSRGLLSPRPDGDGWELLVDGWTDRHAEATRLARDVTDPQARIQERVVERFQIENGILPPWRVHENGEQQERREKAISEADEAIKGAHRGMHASAMGRPTLRRKVLAIRNGEQPLGLDMADISERNENFHEAMELMRGLGLGENQEDAAELMRDFLKRHEDFAVAQEAAKRESVRANAMIELANSLPGASQADETKNLIAHTEQRATALRQAEAEAHDRLSRTWVFQQAEDEPRRYQALSDSVERAAKDKRNAEWASGWPQSAGQLPIS